jgi:hypothetical protein
MKCRYASSIPYLELYKSSRYEEAKIAQVRLHTPLRDPRDSFEEPGLVFKIQKKTSIWIVEQKEGRYCSIDRSNSQQLKTRKS